MPEICDRVPELKQFSEDVAFQVLHDVKYEGYVARQQQQVDRQKRLADKLIPITFDYEAITGLRIEPNRSSARSAQRVGSSHAHQRHYTS